MVDARNDYWMPMDQYIGGIEHAVLHLLYARFWTKVMRDMGMLHFDEPFERLMNHGMLLNHVYSRRTASGGKDYFNPTELVPVHGKDGHIAGGRLADGSTVDYEGIGRMGKSLRNGVDPQDLIDKYGADTARLFVMFVGGPEDASVWSDSGVEGSSRFLRRVWQFGVRHGAMLRRATASDLSRGVLRDEAKSLRRELHTLLKQVRYDYERMQYNTVVSGCMKLLNAMESFAPDGSDGDAAVLCEAISVLLRSLYPACPHIAQALWQQLGFEAAAGSLLEARLPEVDEAALLRDEIELVLQVNGKTRGAVRVPASADKAAIEAAAAAAPEVAKFGEGKAVRKVIVVPGRLVNVVVA
jgi:leucyl-tRNA synthetase